MQGSRFYTVFLLFIWGIPYVNAKTDSSFNIGIRTGVYFPNIWLIKDHSLKPGEPYYLPHSNVPRGMQYCLSAIVKFKKNTFEGEASIRPHIYYRNFKDPLYIRRGLIGLDEYTLNGLHFFAGRKLHEIDKVIFYVCLGYSFYNITTKERPGIGQPVIKFLSNNYSISWKSSVEITKGLFFNISPMLTYQRNRFHENEVVKQSFTSAKLYFQFKTGISFFVD